MGLQIVVLFLQVESCRVQVFLIWYKVWGLGRWVSLGFFFYWLLEIKFIFGRDNGQVVFEVVIDEVVDVVKDFVFCLDL